MKLEIKDLSLRKRRKFQILLLLTAYLIIVILPVGLDLSSAIPQPGKLKTTSIKVTMAKSIVPNIVGKINSGKTTAFIFAQSTMLLPMGNVRYTRLSAASISQIQGCSGSVAFDVTNNFLYPKYRIWEMKCGNFSLTMDQSIHYFRLTRKTGYIVVIAESLGYLVLVFVVCISNRKRYERHN